MGLEALHKQPLVQHPGHLLSSDFCLGVELGSFLSAEEEVRVIKTTPGPLKGTVKFSTYQNDICLSVKTNKPLYICGNSKSVGTHSFSAIEIYASDDYVVKNYSNDFSQIATMLLSGFSNTAKFRSFHMPASSRLLTYICASKGAIHSIASRNIDFENLAAKVSTITPSSESLMQFRTAIKAVLDNSKSRSTEGHGLDNLNRPKICECIGKCFSDQKIGGEISLKLTHRHELCKDLVFWGYDNIYQPISLEKVAAEIHTTSASLSQGCKELLGIGPMTVLRYIRLEHIYQILSDRDIRSKYDLINIEEVREKFGFKTRGNFAALYRKYFNETPRETLLKSNK